MGYSTAFQTWESRVPGPLLIATGEAIPLRGLEGVPGLPGAPQDDSSSSSIELMEKAMALHSSTLAWKIPWVEEPGGLLHSMDLEYSILVGSSVSAALEWKTLRVGPYPLFLGCAARGCSPVVVC